MHFSRFFVTLQEFAGFLCIKAVWGIEEKLGYELETVLNSTFCYKLLNALGFAASLVEEHPKMGHQPFHDSTSGAKVIISDKTTKCCVIFLGSNLILVDLYCFRDYSSSVYSCSTLKDMVAVRLLIPTADAKVARASHETDDTCMENLPLGRLRAYFPHKPRPFQAPALSAHQQRG